MQKSELTIIAGRHSMGKTSFAITLAENLVFKDYNDVLYISYEMNANTITQRLISTRAEVDNYRIKTGHMQNSDWERLAEAMNDFARPKEFEDKQGDILKKGDLKLLASCNMNYIELEDCIRKFATNNPKSVVIIDYFQLIKLTGSEDRITELASVAVVLKRLAMELAIPIIVLSQISKKCEDRTDKRPLINDLSECDALGQHSDNIWLLYRDEYYYNSDDYETKNSIKGKAELIIAKHKNGPVGTINLFFQPNIFKFKNPIKLAETF